MINKKNRSIKKAEVLAKKVAEEINSERRDDSSNASTNSNDSSSSEDEGPIRPIGNNWTPIGNFKQLCHNGKCTWKIRDKYDDICSEIQEADQSRKGGGL